jgi:hypothetical protein
MEPIRDMCNIAPWTWNASFAKVNSMTLTAYEAFPLMMVQEPSLVDRGRPQNRCPSRAFRSSAQVHYSLLSSGLSPIRVDVSNYLPPAFLR